MVAELRELGWADNVPASKYETQLLINKLKRNA